MKTHHFIIVAILFFVLVEKGNSQSIVTPKKVQWKLDKNPVSLKTGFETGVSAPQKLSLELLFDKSILKEVPKEKLIFEFRWFHYYSTRKDFMDSYTIPYKEIEGENADLLSISSSRGNISGGWWEVQVISKVDGKEVVFNDLKKFQIYVK